jgi:hypothetical protein
MRGPNETGLVSWLTWYTGNNRRKQCLYPTRMNTHALRDAPKSEVPRPSGGIPDGLPSLLGVFW